MPALRRRGALGLRGRIVGAVLVTTVATLAVAALALLGPLEQSLKNTEKATLRIDLRKKNTLRPFEKLDFAALPLSAAARSALQHAEDTLANSAGATTVTVYG